jgi:hypothetical protein
LSPLDIFQLKSKKFTVKNTKTVLESIPYPGFEPRTSHTPVYCSNHYATEPSFKCDLKLYTYLLGLSKNFPLFVAQCANQLLTSIMSIISSNPEEKR